MVARNDKSRGGKSAPDSLRPNSPENGRETIRLDKWLFYARFFKTRGFATEVITKGRVRLNGQRQCKPGHAIGAGDVLTFPMARHVRVVKVVGLGERRGPPSEAQTLYIDLDLPNAEDHEIASPLE